VPATTTDEFTDEDLWSVFQTFTDGFKTSVCHIITDGLKSVGIFLAGIYFWRTISVCKTIGKLFSIFPINIVTEYGITNERKAEGLFPSVMTSVNKLPTKS
jgi:hypothetical protein